jgi:solute carrier family 10 (sodium/bile acid cotransporter), member 7
VRFVCRVLARLRLDPYVAAILLTVGVATLIPCRGGAATALDRVVTVAIAVVFFLYGVKVPTGQAVQSLRHWRLHMVTVLLTFGAFPVLALAGWLLVPSVLDSRLYGGVVFLCVLPSTVQSSVALTGIARGNEAAAICSASLSSLLGVVLTPVLTAVLISAGGAGLSGKSLGDIALRLLLPFLLGQLAQRRIGRRVRARTRQLSLLDRGVILLMVYLAFSRGLVTGVWHRLEPAEFVPLLIIIAALLAVALVGADSLSRVFGFTRDDRVTVLFCGSQKSLAMGLPMATVIFAEDTVGLMILPLMLYHQLQLLVCSWLARRFGTTPNRVVPERRWPGWKPTPR